MLDNDLATPDSPASSKRPGLSLESLTHRLDVLRWAVPGGLLLLVVIYELGVRPWVQATLGQMADVVLDIVLYGSVGPLLSYFLLTFIDRWLAERETSALQSQALHQARAQVQRTHDLTDDALQTLFATSLLLDHLTHDLPGQSADAADKFRQAEQAVNRAIEQLYSTKDQIKH